MKRFRCLFCFVLLVFLLGVIPADRTASASEPVILYVKYGGDGNCLAWTTACDLQTALAASESGTQIYVAAGTYYPTTGTDRNVSFQLLSGVQVYGGFPVAGGEWFERDPFRFTTTLSGNIGDTESSLDNSFNVVIADNVNASTVLDGFTITGGRASGSSIPSAMGGGIYINASFIKLENLILDSNYASYGGGIYNYSSSPTILHSHFLYNTAKYGGGGIQNANSHPTLVNVLFQSNRAETSYGGAIWSDSTSKVSVDRALFVQNFAKQRGGAVYSFITNGSLTITNATFVNNHSDQIGGAIMVENGAPNLSNLTITENSAIGSGGGIYCKECILYLKNSILGENTGGEIYIEGSAPTNVTYSDIQGTTVFPGTGNITSDPLLVSLADNGGFLQTMALPEGSPAIDAGDPASCPATDQRGVPRPLDGDANYIKRCDMGAFEFSDITYRIQLPLIIR